uniref:uncharacterized protein n=1 Tax=Semicossyphus pulcher TaxID=241346 RepID=UPI0037E83CB3
MKMFLLFVLLVHVSQHASGVAVHVYEGAESVLLPCDVLRGLSDPKVLWSRFDLNPTTVQQHGKVFHVLNPRYSGRTSVSPGIPGFFFSDFSLTLNKPRLCDSGIYTCIVFTDEYKHTQINVELQVTEPYTFPAEAQFLLGLLGLLALVLVGALGVADYLWKNTITVSQVEVKEGEWVVVLPYKIMVFQPEDFTVEWTRCAPEPMKVHAYHNGRNHLINQDAMYHGRTSMKRDSLLTVDLSLALKDPCYEDSGTYICTVHREQEILRQKVVRLQVKVVQEVEEGSETFTLPYITTAQLPEDATVEWRRSEPGNMTVHVYEMGQDQPNNQDECYLGRTMMTSDPLRSKDLSVSVNNPGYNDRGTYICTVRREGYILAQKEVVIRVI